MKIPVRKAVPVDASQWSEKSQRSLDYMCAPSFYEDKPFDCYACGCKSVFTAEQQKREYEVKKAFIWQQHVLCHGCFLKRHELSSQDEALSQRWENDKVALKTDVPALLHWIAILESLPSYGVRRDTGRIRMLRKLAENAA